MTDRDGREPAEEEREAPAPPEKEDETVTPTRRDRPVRLEYAVPRRESWERR